MDAFDEPPQHDSVLFLIDASSAFGLRVSVLGAVCQAIMNNQLFGPHNLSIGVVLADFSKPAIPRVLVSVSNPKLHELIKSIELARLDAEHGARGLIGFAESKENGLVSALKLVDSEFAEVKEKALFRLVVVTGLDRVNAGINTVTDLFTKLRIKYSTLFLSLFLGPRFDPEEFWSLMPFQSYSEEESYKRTGLATDSLLNLTPTDMSRTTQREFTDLVKSKASRKVSSFKAFLLIGEIAINLSFYRIVKERKPQPRSLFYPFQPHQPHQPHQPRQPQPYPEQNGISLSEKQLEAVSSYDEFKSLIINRFIPITKIPRLPRFGNSYFLVPTNRLAPNSKLAFTSLHRTMRKLNVAACVTLNANKAPVRGYLYASGQNYTQLEPSTLSGMYFVPIACIDELRKSSYTHTSLSSAEPLMNELVSKLYINYSPTLFIDPKVTQWASSFEQTALSQHALQTEVEDLTVPNYRGLQALEPECTAIKACIDKNIQKI